MSDLREDELDRLQNQAGLSTPRGEMMSRLIAEVRRYRATVSFNAEHVRDVVREALARFALYVLREDDVGAIVDRVVSRLAVSVIEMRLCEAHRVVLCPDRLYRFTVAPGCALCTEAAQDVSIINNPG